MKNIIKTLFLFLLFIAISEVTLADSEEDECFKLLDKAVENDVRFKNSSTLEKGNLTQVLYNETTSSKIDLNKYEEFKKYTSKNPAYTDTRRNSGLNNKDFLLRRGHIAPIFAEENYIVSNIVSFGRDSNFTFPLSASSTEKSYGDPYNSDGKTFKEYLVYTHHSIKGDFLSCGIIKIVPLGSRTFGEISEDNYFTNILDGFSEQEKLGGEKCHSGFEGEKIASGGKNFYSMKSNICVVDYTPDDLVKMELISIAYDNKSDFYNEYVIFPLQVESMRNRDTEKDGLVEIRNAFLEKVNSKTCLKLVHGKNEDLPEGCEEKFSSNLVSFDTKSILNNVLSFVLPTTYAARDLNFSQDDIDKASGMLVYESMPYSVYEKLMTIEDTTFRDFLRMALVENFEDYILERQRQGIVISPFEEVFLNCKIPYSEREEIVIDFINNLKDTKNVDLTSLTYSNSKFGDCVVPYPDKRNIAKVIPGSFDSNQLLAEQLSGNYVGPEVSQEVINLAKAQNELTLEYQSVVDKLTEDYTLGKITSEDLNRRIEEEKVNLDEAIQNLFAENEKLKEQINENLKNLNTAGLIKNPNTNTNTIIIAVLLIVLGITITFYVIAKKGKTKQE